MTPSQTTRPRVHAVRRENAVQAVTRDGELSATNHPRRLRVARLAAGYGAIACALPYLGLKLVWLGGGTLGIADRALMRDASMLALNALTAGMDLVGMGIVLAFTHQWGLRIPAWLLLPPMWAASGLLAKFIVWVPIAAITALASGSLPRVAGGPVQPWVYAVVYVGFAGLGIGLMLAFLLYARARWADVLQPTTVAFQASATLDVQVPLANTAALLAIALGVLHLGWAFGATVGLSEEATRHRTILGSLINAIDAAMMLAAAAGVLMIVHRRARRAPFLVPLAMTWVGAGSLFAWGLWPLINVLGKTALLRGAQRMGLVDLVHLLCVLVGLTIGLLTLFVLAERRSYGRVCLDTDEQEGRESRYRPGGTAREGGV